MVQQEYQQHSGADTRAEATESPWEVTAARDERASRESSGAGTLEGACCFGVLRRLRETENEACSIWTEEAYTRTYIPGVIG